MANPALLAPPRTWRQKLLWLLGCAAFFALVYFAHHAASRPVPVESPVEQAVREAEAATPGWQHDDLEAAREPVPDGENSAFLVRRAAENLPPYWQPMARFGFFSSRPDALTVDERDRLAAELGGSAPALEEALPLADRPRGRHPAVKSDRPWAPPQPHLEQVGRVVTLLRLETFRRAAAGDALGAGRSSAAALNAARSVGDEPNLAAQLTRKFYAAAACRGVQFLVNHAEPDGTALYDLQRCLEEEAGHPGFRIGVRGYRAQVHLLLEAVESGKVRAWDAFPAPDPAELLWRAPPSADELALRHAELLPVLTRAVELAGEPAPRRAALLRDLVNELDPESFRLLGPLVRELPANEHQFTSRDATLLCTAAALAAERYRRDHKDWPPSLEALAPDYLGAVPADPADGRPLRFHRFSDGIVVYSVSRDRMGGQYDPTVPVSSQGVAVRLWDVSERGRPPQIVSEIPVAPGPRPAGPGGRVGGPPGLIIPPVPPVRRP
jgi:hypothetical protein